MENQGGDYSPNGFSNSASNMNAVFNNEITGRSDISNVNHQTGTPRLVPETQIWSMPVPDRSGQKTEVGEPSSAWLVYEVDT